MYEIIAYTATTWLINNHFRCKEPCLESSHDKSYTVYVHTLIKYTAVRTKGIGFK